MLPAFGTLRTITEVELADQSSSHSSSPLSWLSSGRFDALGVALLLTIVDMVEDWPPPTEDDDEELLLPGNATTLLFPAPTLCLALFSFSVDVAIGTLLPMSPSPDP